LATLKYRCTMLLTGLWDQVLPMLA
jgi:hypothetical protein